MDSHSVSEPFKDADPFEQNLRHRCTRGALSDRNRENAMGEW